MPASSRRTEARVLSGKSVEQKAENRPRVEAKTLPAWVLRYHQMNRIQTGAETAHKRPQVPAPLRMRVQLRRLRRAIRQAAHRGCRKYEVVDGLLGTNRAELQFRQKKEYLRATSCLLRNRGLLRNKGYSVLVTSKGHSVKWSPRNRRSFVISVTDHKYFS